MLIHCFHDAREPLSRPQTIQVDVSRSGTGDTKRFRPLPGLSGKREGSGGQLTRLSEFENFFSRVLPSVYQLTSKGSGSYVLVLPKRKREVGAGGFGEGVGTVRQAFFRGLQGRLASDWENGEEQYDGIELAVDEGACDDDETMGRPRLEDSRLLECMLKRGVVLCAAYIPGIMLIGILISHTLALLKTNHFPPSACRAVF